MEPSALRFCGTIRAIGAVVHASVVKPHARVGINCMVRLLKRVVNKAQGRKHRRRSGFHPPNPELSEQLFSHVGYVEDFSSRERSWAPVSATD